MIFKKIIKLSKELLAFLTIGFLLFSVFLFFIISLRGSSSIFRDDVFLLVLSIIILVIYAIVYYIYGKIYKQNIKKRFLIGDLNLKVLKISALLVFMWSLLVIAFDSISIFIFNEYNGLWFYETDKTIDVIQFVSIYMVPSFCVWIVLKKYYTHKEK